MLTLQRSRTDNAHKPPIGRARVILPYHALEPVDAMKLRGSLTMRVSASHDWRHQDDPTYALLLPTPAREWTLKTLGKFMRRSLRPRTKSAPNLGCGVSAQLVERLQGDLRVSSTTRPGRNGTAFSSFLTREVSKQRDRSGAAVKRKVQEKDPRTNCWIHPE